MLMEILHIPDVKLLLSSKKQFPTISRFLFSLYQVLYLLVTASYKYLMLMNESVHCIFRSFAISKESEALMCIGESYIQKIRNNYRKVLNRSFLNHSL